jgi:hypothetical protein
MSCKPYLRDPCPTPTKKSWVVAIKIKLSCSSGRCAMCFSGVVSSHSSSFSSLPPLSLLWHLLADESYDLTGCLVFYLHHLCCCCVQRWGGSVRRRRFKEIRGVVISCVQRHLSTRVTPLPVSQPCIICWIPCSKKYTSFPTDQLTSLNQLGWMAM